MSVQKKHLKEILDHFGKDLLKDFLDSKNLKGKSKKKELVIDIIVQNSTIDELLKFIGLNLSKMRNHVALYEIDDVSKELSAQEIQNHTSNSNPNFDSITNFSNEGKFQNGIFYGLTKILVEGYPFDPEEMDEDDLDENNLDTFPFYIPFQVIFHNGKYFKIRIMKFSPSKVHPIQDGGHIYIEENPFDYYGLSSDISKHFIANLKLPSFDRANVTTAIKNLVKAKKINAVTVKCDDDKNNGFHHRSMHNDGSKTFVEWKWFDDHCFYTTDKVYDTTWGYVENKVMTDTFTKYDRLKVECQNGIVSKNYNSDDDLKWFLDEIIKSN